MIDERTLLFAKINFILNFIFAVYNFVLGISMNSLWFLVSGAYYIVLAVMRFGAVAMSRRESDGIFVMKFSGILLVLLSWVLSWVAYLSITRETAQSYHEIVMITIACYAFTKITLAIIKVIRARKENSPLLTTIRHISLADAAVSIFTLQRSMLVSFPGMGDGEILLMNALTGAGACAFVCVLGILMIVKKRNKNCETVEEAKKRLKK